MAVAVVDLDLAYLPPDLKLASYHEAYVVVRNAGRPVGRLWLALDNGVLRRQTLEAALSDIRQQQRRQALEQEILAQESPFSFYQPATIAICTRDRPGDLQRCLASLAVLPNDGQEILVVDNGASEAGCAATRAVVESFSGVRYVREPQPGLDNARNRALYEARHEIVAFLDDDATAEVNWLRALVVNFRDPLVLVVTGLTFPIELETAAQEWFERHSSFVRGFSRTVYDSHVLSPTSAGMVGSGVNMALRRSVLEHIGSFNRALDAGTPTHSGGDTDMFTRVLAAGYQIVYEPSAVNWHRHRRSWPELQKVLYGYGVGVYAAYTHAIVALGEWGALKSAWGWFRYRQLPTLVRALLRRPNTLPLDLILAELRGCAIGPMAYARSRRNVRKNLGRLC